MESASRDELYPAAFRLARLYAIISPRVLAQELKIDRERAERLLAELEAAGAVGPTLIKGTGARESRVNIVEDKAPERSDGMTVLGTIPRLGRRALAVGVAAALGGLALTLLLHRIGVGRALVIWFNVELGSPTLAAVIAHTVPLVGLGAAWLAELPFRFEEDLIPMRYVRARRAVWNGALIVAVLYSIVRLLS